MLSIIAVLRCLVEPCRTYPSEQVVYTGARPARARARDERAGSGNTVTCAGRRTAGARGAARPRRLRRLAASYLYARHVDVAAALELICHRVRGVFASRTTRVCGLLVSVGPSQLRRCLLVAAVVKVGKALR